MAWIKIHHNLKDHPKLHELMRLMGWDKDKAIGKLVMFWLWCSNYADNGDLQKYNDEILGSAVELNREESKKFIDSMIQSCWIEREPYFRIHDWWDHFKDFLQSKYSHSPDKYEKVKQLYSNCLATAKQDKIERKIERKIDKAITNVNHLKIKKSKTETEGFKEVIDLIDKKWLINGSKYPISGIDGKNVKKLISLYGIAKTMALIDLFWQECDDWTRSHIGRNMKGLMHELSKLLDNSRLKILESKYQTEIDNKLKNPDSPKIEINFQPVPHGNTLQDQQAKKVESLVALKSI